jgi:ATP-binding cassette subfamily B multidrug efflux pump
MLKLLRNLTRRDWLCVAAVVVLVVIQVDLDLTIPDYMADITTLVETEGSTMADVLSAGGKMLLCALGSLITGVGIAYLVALVAANFSAELRSRLFRQVMSFSMQEISHFSTDSLITRTTNDVLQVQNFLVMGLNVLIKAPVMAVWAITKIWNRSWQWTMSTAVAVICLLALILVCLAIATPEFKKMQVYTDNLNRVTRESLDGVNVIRAWNAEDYQKAKSEDANEKMTHANKFANRTMSFIMPGIQLIMNGLTLVIYVIGAFLIEQRLIDEKLTVFSDMIVFSSYAVQVVMSFLLLTVILVLLPRAQTAAERINEVLDTRITIRDGNGAKVPEGQTGVVEFRDVSFRYPDSGADVVSHISFTAKKGQTVALIGATGCGKSTILNLIPRFYDVREGQVLVDGVDVKDYTLEDLRSRIGYVAQKSVLFTGDTASNISYARKEDLPDMAVVDSAAAAAEAKSFSLDENGEYHRYVAQGGTNFSGGQKQRLSIARAVAQDPEIYLFDDSFSALDFATDRKVRQNLRETCGDATKIIVAQRIGTIRDADQIIVLDQGKIAGIGTHEELMKNCAVYQEIAKSQMTKEELA